jgi:hypothetical protein
LNFGFLLCLLPLGKLSLLAIGAGLFITNIGVPIYNINQVSLRQIITPQRLQGRMNATMRTIVWGTIPLGSFIGGALTTLIGIIPTLTVSAILSGLAFLWIVLANEDHWGNKETPHHLGCQRLKEGICFYLHA